MKITCCCLTCIIGEEKEEQKEETSHLLHPDEEEEEEKPTPRDKQPTYSRSTSAVSSASTLRGLSTESADPTSESLEGNVATKEKFTKAVGVLRKYNVMSSKYNTKELQRQLTSPAQLRLKVGIKVMPRSSTVKVSVIEAHDVMPMLQIKGLPETGSSTDQEQGLVVQVRTKVMESEVRGHTKKYEIQGGLTGALKMRNETVHTLNLEEFLHCKIRFRLYYVLKHQRDKLLGEYVLDIPSLNFDVNNPISHTMLDLYDPAIANLEPSVKSPDVVPITTGALSVDKQLSTDKDTQSTPKIQRQAKIRGQDSELRFTLHKEQEKGSAEEKSEGDSTPTPTKKTFSKAFKSIRSTASHIRVKEHGSKEKDQRSKSAEITDVTSSTEHLSASERLKMAVKERSEKVEELEEATAAMADTASNFSALSVKLKEKYMSESGKKSKSAES